MASWRLKADWLTYLHRLRTEEMHRIFGGCPPALFGEGLELGAGDGFQSALLARYVRSLISTDVDRKVLAAADVQRPNAGGPSSPGRVEYRVGDAERVAQDFPPRRFDLVFSSNLLEHLEHPDRALRGIHTVLRDNGLTIHVIPSPLWKLANLLLHVPNSLVMLVQERLSEGRDQGAGARGQGSGVRAEIQNLRSQMPDLKSKTDRPTLRRLTPAARRRATIRNLLVPQVHGVSATNLGEFRAFSRSRWLEAFAAAGFDVVQVRKAPLGSGHGFGFERLRRLLQRLGLTSGFIYIAVKHGGQSPCTKYFL
jgi:SAM-dependent methyltransferase